MADARPSAECPAHAHLDAGSTCAEAARSFVVNVECWRIGAGGDDAFLGDASCGARSRSAAG